MVCAELFFWVFFWFLWFFWKIGILDFLISWDILKFSISLEVDNTPTFSQFQNSF